MIRISPISEVKKCFKTVEPKEPVPPVMTRVRSLNVSVMLDFMFSMVLCFSFIFDIVVIQCVYVCSLITVFIASIISLQFIYRSSISDANAFMITLACFLFILLLLLSK